MTIYFQIKKGASLCLCASPHTGDDIVWMKRVLLSRLFFYVICDGSAH